MRPGYSKLLINDNIIPVTHAPPQITTVDMIMMVKVAAQERTDPDYRALVESVGLKATKIWSEPGMQTSMIEAEVA